MAMRMNHCTSCRKHFFLTDARCPHCGTEAAGGPAARFVRQAKMGGLMLFTALTTTACYGTPALVEGPNRPLPPSVEEPKERVPTTLGTAFLYARDAGGAADPRTVRLMTASIEGAVLKLSSTLANGVTLTIEADTAAAFQPVQGVREALPVEKMKRLEIDAAFTRGTSSEYTHVNFKGPGGAALKGTLQLSRLDETAIGGTLIVSEGDKQVTLYFLAGR
jgi:rRNA maturation protein Nop10